MFTNIPEAAVLLYKYTDDAFTNRDLTSSGFVGSAFIYQDRSNLLYIRAR